MNIKKLLGKRIQEIRKSKKLTQEQVAELVGIEVVSLSNIENGKYYPTAENLEKIINILDVSAEKLFCFGHHETPENLVSEIVEILEKNPDKIKDFYKILKALVD